MKLDHRLCRVSTGIHEDPDADGSPDKPWGLTYGQGELDSFGYWQFPCEHCARKAERKDNVPAYSYWPFY